MIYSRITGTGSGLPQNCVSNAELAEQVDTSDEWIRQRTGIHQRYLVAAGETSADLAEIACREALQAAKVAPEQIDLTIVATATPDYAFPSTACLLQERLGIRRTGGAFDLEAACSGFIYALDVADRFLRTRGAETALVVGTDTLSKLVDWQDRSTCVLFGDGAGAVVLQATQQAGILSSRLHADGRGQDLLKVLPPAPGSNSGNIGHIHMQGGEVFKLAVRCLAQAAEQVLQENKLSIPALNWFIPHQANIRIINAVGRKLGLSEQQIVRTIDQHGNTSAAAIPLALDLAVRDQRIQRDHLVLLAAIGSGITWGAALMRF